MTGQCARLRAETIASEQARSIHTIRDQRKSVMGKLGVSRQVDLVLLLNRLRGRGATS